MSRQERRRIAEETIQVTHQGRYQKHGKTIALPKEDYSVAILIDAKEAKRCGEVVKSGRSISDTPDIYVLDADSFACAEGMENVLVMNFANAHVPGGGFRNGANAQEECLCRESTLYHSIGSDAAYEMYDYNNRRKNACDSDYMILSPHVCVFRDLHDDFLDEPFLTSVITIPAPNRNGAAREVSPAVLSRVMKSRLRKMFAVAAAHGYSSLVLGAWGCGAFGHDPYSVAKYFYDILMDEEYHKYFRTIAFAIIDRGEKKNFRAFADVFQNVGTICTNDTSETVTLVPGFYQTNHPFITYNFSQENISPENKGYSYGTTKNGIPFMAEIWEQTDGDRAVAFYLPVTEDFMKLEGVPLVNEATDTKTFFVQKPVKAFHALCVGMADGGMVDDLSVLFAYVRFLEEYNLLAFSTDLQNAYAFLLTDVTGHDLIAITISLTIEGETVASTPLSWIPFHHSSPKRTHLRLV